MLEEKELQIIEKTVREFFKKAGFEIEIEMEYLKEEQDLVEINIFKLEDAKIFIGKQGTILADIQLLL